MLLNLMNLSMKNDFVNEKGEPFVKLSRNKIKELLNVRSNEKISSIMKELTSYGLIEERNCSNNSCNEIYLFIIEDFKNDFKFTEEKKFNAGYEIEITTKCEDEFTGASSSEENGVYDEIACTILHSDDEEVLPSKNEGWNFRKMELPTFENRKYKKNNNKKNNLKNKNIHERCLVVSKIEVKEDLNNEAPSKIEFKEMISNELPSKIKDKEMAGNELTSKIEAKEIIDNKPSSKIEGEEKRDFFIDDSDIFEEYINSIKGTNSYLGSDPKNVKNIFQNHKREEGKIYGFEKAHMETVREFYGQYKLSDKDVDSLLNVAKGNLYKIDLAHEQALSKRGNIKNFVAYNIAIIKNMA